MKAILLAGGQGSRLRPLTLNTPKPIVPIFDRPFLRYQIELLKQAPEIDEIVLSLNYQPRRIEEVFGDGSDLGVQIRYVVEPQPLGTGGAIKFAAGPKPQGPVVVFNGDVLTSVDLPALLALHRERRARATIVLTPVDNPSAFGLVETDANGNITAFREKPAADEITVDTINAGIYVIEGETLDRIPAETAYSIERGYFPSLIERHETFVAHIYRGYWIDIGTPREVPAGPYRHHDRPVQRAAVSGRGRHGGGVARGAHRARARSSKARASSMPALWSRQGARIGPYSVIGAHSPHFRRRADRRRHSLAAHVGRSARKARPSGGGPPLSVRPQCRSRRRGHARRQLRRHGLFTAMTILPSIFKAYDVRALYPSELDEAAAHLIGRAYVAYLESTRPAGLAPLRIAVSRDMRLSSPSLSRAVRRWRARAGRQHRGLRAGVHGHDVFRRGERGLRRRRADHGVAQSEGIQRHEDGAARCRAAVGRCRHRRHSRHGRGRHAFPRPRDPRAPTRPARCSTPMWTG